MLDRHILTRQPLLWVIRSALGVLLILTAFSAPVAEGAGGGDPVILKPANASGVRIGFGGPVRVDFTGADFDTYHIKVFGLDTSYSWGPVDWTYDGNQTTKAFYIDSINAPGRYKAVVADSANTWRAVSRFTVSRPLVIDNVRATPDVFYPQVRDGYRDVATIAFRINQGATLSARVHSRDGSTIRRLDIGHRRAGSQRWSWNGRRNNGSLAPTGYYGIEITGRSDYGNSKSVSRRVRLATGYVISRKSVARPGISTSSTSHSSSCYVDRDNYYDTVTLDCWGGKYSQATYAFNLPANAFNLRWGVSGRQHCCENGVIVRRGERLNPRRFRILVKVTYWRSYEVSRVHVAYSYKRRI